MLRFTVLLALATMACAQPDTPDRVVEPRAFAGGEPRSEAFLRAAMVAGHDTARNQVGVPRLTWDATLAADALGYARELARTARFEHSRGRRGVEPQGENLWTGTRGAYRYEEMVGHWVAERRFLRPGLVPNISRSGRFEDVGHYTQIIWPTTTRFGCAMATGDRDDFLVCRYAVPGNVYGRSPLR